TAGVTRLRLTSDKRMTDSRVNQGIGCERPPQRLNREPHSSFITIGGDDVPNARSHSSHAGDPLPCDKLPEQLVDAPERNPEPLGERALGQRLLAVERLENLSKTLVVIARARTGAAPATDWHQ